MKVMRQSNDDSNIVKTLIEAAINPQKEHENEFAKQIAAILNTKPKTSLKETMQKEAQDLPMPSLGEETDKIDLDPVTEPTDLGAEIGEEDIGDEAAGGDPRSKIEQAIDILTQAKDQLQSETTTVLDEEPLPEDGSVGLDIINEPPVEEKDMLM